MNSIGHGMNEPTDPDSAVIAEADYRARGDNQSKRELP
jgi:hypothetical protein